MGELRVSGFYAGLVPPGSQTRSERFGQAIRLLSVAVPQTTLGPGQIIPAALTWEAIAPISQTVTAFLHLEDSEHLLVAQRDAAPLDGYLQATSWEVGQAVTDLTAVRLPWDAPAGEYRLYLGLYDAFTGERLRITPPQPDDQLLLGYIRVGP
jgi:hypothetical protein